MMIEKQSQVLQSLNTLPLPEPSDQVENSVDQKLNGDPGLIHRLWGIRIFRFLVIGAINTFFSYIVYALLILINVHYSLATLISTVLGVIFNFFTTGRIVFRNMDNHRFFRFGLVYAFTYFVNILLLRWLVDGIQMSKLLAGALVTLPVALLSYLLNAKWTFRAMEAGQENLNQGMDNA
jgi:putative flippase GtrA